MPTTSPDKLEIGPSTIPAVENTTRKPAKPSDKPIIGRATKVQHSLKISQHPLFDKENHPTEGANTLKDLQDNTNNNEYGPWWFEFLSRAMDYDRHLFDWSYKTEQNLKGIQNERNQVIQDRNNAIQEKKDIIQGHSNMQELFSSVQLKVERLLQENKTLTSCLPPQKRKIKAVCTHGLAWSHVCSLAILPLSERNLITKNIRINLIYVFDILNSNNAYVHAHAHVHTSVYIHKADHIFAHKFTNKIGCMATKMICWHA